jgi:hypothetical protein
LEKAERLSLIRQRPSPKADRIFAALEEGYPNAKINGYEYDRFVLWGLVGNNMMYMMAPYIFVDMPYHGRLNTLDPDYENSYWRWCYDGVHNSTKMNVPSDRFEEWNVKLQPYKTGDQILICPSSETMTKAFTGMSVDQWVEKQKMEIQKHTNKPIKVRLKPRKKGTSGPSVAEIPVEEDLKNSHALVTLASLTAIDALKMGVPVYSSHPNLCPSAWVTQSDYSTINKPEQLPREELFFNLAYKQFSIKEMRDGTLYENIMRLSYN